MTETTTRDYWAITGLGWGRGATAEEAVANYRKAMKRDYPKVNQYDLDEAWGWVWLEPEEATGYWMDSELWWKMEGGTVQKAEDSQRVHTIGNVPARVLFPQGVSK